jgi:hypothetical protein
MSGSATHDSEGSCFRLRSLIGNAPVDPKSFVGQVRLPRTTHSKPTRPDPWLGSSVRAGLLSGVASNAPPITRFVIRHLLFVMAA